MTRRSDDDDDDALASALTELPLFPLPGVVFFPHTLLPLHVFEARYRQLTEHVLQGHKHIAVVPICAERQDAPVGGVARVAGVGRIVRQERLPDGRFHLLLQGVARAELVVGRVAESAERLAALVERQRRRRGEEALPTLETEIYLAAARGESTASRLAAYAARRGRSHWVVARIEREVAAAGARPGDEP